MGPTSQNVKLSYSKIIFVFLFNKDFLRFHPSVRQWFKSDSYVDPSLPDHVIYKRSRIINVDCLFWRYFISIIIVTSSYTWLGALYSYSSPLGLLPSLNLIVSWWKHWWLVILLSWPHSRGEVDRDSQLGIGQKSILFFIQAAICINSPHHCIAILLDRTHVVLSPPHYPWC